MVSEYKIEIYIEIIKKNNRQSKNPNKRWGFRLNSYEGGEIVSFASTILIPTILTKCVHFVIKI